MTVLGSQYELEILRKLGSGYFGDVYLAKLVGVPGEYAVKFIEKAKLDPQKFLHEADKMKRAASQNVVKFVWAGESKHPDAGPGTTQCSTHIQVIMEYYPDGSVDSKMPDCGYSVGEARKIITDVIQGLEACHSNDILHLDIKPSNILRCADGNHVLSDFGQSLLLNQRGLADGRNHPLYVAHRPPEGPTFTEMSDFWQVGLTLYRLLTGASAPTLEPFVRNPKVHKLPGIEHCPTSFRRLLDKLVDPKPDKRPSSSIDILASLSKVHHLLGWKKDCCDSSFERWSSERTCEVLEMVEDDGLWTVSYKKKDRRNLKLCPKTDPLPHDLAKLKVQNIFRNLEKM